LLAAKQARVLVVRVLTMNTRVLNACEAGSTLRWESREMGCERDIATKGRGLLADHLFMGFRPKSQAQVAQRLVNGAVVVVTAPALQGGFPDGA